MQQQQQSNDDYYDSPTTQIVLLKGSSCFEPISLPQLQTYFNNVQLLNRQYGYFQITHFDFPLNDSLTKTFGTDTATLQLKVVQELDTNDPNIAGSLTSTNTIQFNLKRTHSTVDVASTLKNAIGVLDDTTNSDEYNWQYWLQDVVYDGSAQKLCFVLAPPTVTVQYGHGLFRNTFYLKRLTFTLSGSQIGKQGELAAAVMGGKMNTDGTVGWHSEFDTGYTDWFKLSGQALGNTAKQAKLSVAQSFIVSSQRPTRMFVDPYVFIRGAPEQSVWRPDGTTTDIMTIQPRNRPPGVITNSQAFVGGQTHRTKTSLASLRSMNLRFTDSEGNVIQLDEEYVIKIAIEFKE